MGKRNVILLVLLILTISPLITAYELCDERISEDELEIVEIIDPEQSSTTEWSWTPTEQVNIEVEVRNKNLTTRTFRLELFLLDEDSDIKNITTDEAIPSQTISLDKNENGILNFSFQLDEPNDDLYYLYAKLYDGNNDSVCTSQMATSSNEETPILIEEEEKIITIRNASGPTNVTAGSKVKYNVEIINLGNSKEDRILIIAYNANLKIREEIEVTELASEATKTVTFNLTIPENATTQKEIFLFSTEYDYDNDTGFYYQSSEKSKALSVQVEASEAQVTQINENQTTQVEETTNNSTQQPTTTQEQESIAKKIPIIFWVTIPLVLVAIAIIAIILSRKKEYIDASPPTPSAATNYVKNIQKDSTATTTPPSKPSETNTSSTKTLPTS